MNKPLIIGIIVLVILVFGGFLLFNQTKNQIETLPLPIISQQPPTASIDEQVDSTASFAIFTNGTFRIFTAAMYHNLSKDAFIESSNPNIVRVKKAGTTWGDFFSTLPFKLTPDCLTTGTKETFCTGNRGTLKFYINGEQSNNALSQEIKEGDKLLVTFGNEADETIRKQFNMIP